MKGHVYRRGKTFTYVFDGPPDPLSGKRAQVTKGGFATEREAWSACREAMKRAEEGRHVAPSRRTVGGYLVDEWLPAIKSATKPTTWANWKVYVDSYVVPVLGPVKLQQLTAPQLQAFYDHLLTKGRVKVDTVSAMYELWRQGREAGKEPTPRRLASTTGATIHAARAALRRFRTGQVPKGRTPGLAPKTVRNVHVMLHKALADAAKWRYVVENVAASANAPKPGRRRPTVWTPEQLGTFLRFVQADRFYALFLLAATTGLRRAELCGLHWSAVDLTAATLAVEETRVVVNGRAEDGDGKSDNAPRLLSLDPATVAALRDFLSRQRGERAFFKTDYRDTDRVFTWEDGRPVHPDVIRQRFNRLSARCGLPHIRLHDIRHSYATASLKASVNPKIVSQRLGHASVGFTLSVYSHALPGIDREAAGTIADLILGESGEEDDR
ncbi:tyrosine-type recombinase/integrase [Phytohabitans kaempferiae]|uniref:Tyrosine-type recombinase/integrase n=1 Tax=Phytohabitans kaempferiae TaxID=1620943 RepID=A0ABV6LV33_9ACTN